MGEYAIRKSDNVEIKIGTCESMYYIRYEDRFKVSKLPGSLNPATCLDLFWRIPFPDEDHVAIGEYDPYERGLRLFKMVPDGRGHEYAEDFPAEDLAKHPGIVQLHHQDSGLLLNVPCYHGVKLPEVQPPMKAFWNGKGHSIELKHVKNTAEGLRPIIGCRHCGKIWRCDWEDVLPYVYDSVIRARLMAYAEDKVT